MNINETLAKEFKLRQEQIDNTVSLIDDGKTIPFIARYRKELTGSLDDQLLREIFDRLTYLRGLEKRKEEISAAITEQGKMTDELAAAIAKAATLVEVEDIYRPYKPRRAVLLPANGVLNRLRSLSSRRTSPPTPMPKRKNTLTKKRKSPTLPQFCRALWTLSPRIFPTTQS